MHQNGGEGYDSDESIQQAVTSCDAIFQLLALEAFGMAKVFVVDRMAQSTKKLIHTIAPVNISADVTPQLTNPGTSNAG